MQVLSVSEFLSGIYFRKMSKRMFPLPWSTVPKTFYPVAQKKVN